MKARHDLVARILKRIEIKNASKNLDGPYQGEKFDVVAREI